MIFRCEKGTHYKNITKTFLSSWCRSSSHQFFLVNLLFPFNFWRFIYESWISSSFLVPPTPFQICSLYSLVHLLRTYMSMFINITYWSFSVAWDVFSSDLLGLVKLSGPHTWQRLMLAFSATINCRCSSRKEALRDLPILPWHGNWCWHVLGLTWVITLFMFTRYSFPVK